MRTLLLMSTTALSVLSASLIGVKIYTADLQGRGYSIEPQQEERLNGLAVNSALYGATAAGLTVGILSLCYGKLSDAERRQAVREFAQRKINQGQSIGMWAAILSEVDEG